MELGLGLFCSHRHLQALIPLYQYKYSRVTNVSPPVQQQKFEPNCALKRETESKNSSKPTRAWLNKKIKVVQQPKVQTATRLKYYRGTWRELHLKECLQNSVNWSNTVQKSRPKLLPSDVRDENSKLQVIAAKGRWIMACFTHCFCILVYFVGNKETYSVVCPVVHLRSPPFKAWIIFLLCP